MRNFCDCFKPVCNPCKSSLDQRVDTKIVRGSNFSDFIGCCCCPCGGNKGFDCDKKDDKKDDCKKDDKCDDKKDFDCCDKKDDCKKDDWKCCEYKCEVCEKCDRKKDDKKDDCAFCDKFEFPDFLRK